MLTPSIKQKVLDTLNNFFSVRSFLFAEEFVWVLTQGGYEHVFEIYTITFPGRVVLRRSLTASKIMGLLFCNTFPSAVTITKGYRANVKYLSILEGA